MSDLRRMKMFNIALEAIPQTLVQMTIWVSDDYDAGMRAVWYQRKQYLTGPNCSKSQYIRLSSVTRVFFFSTQRVVPPSPLVPPKLVEFQTRRISVIHVVSALLKYVGSASLLVLPSLRPRHAEMFFFYPVAVTVL